MKTITSNNAVLKVIISLLVFSSFFSKDVLGQANSVRTGVIFNWVETQPTINDPATIESIVIGGSVYNTFVVPTSYEMTRLGPGGHNGNDIMQNGTELVGSSSDPNWNSFAIDAYQSLNLNHYFESNSNGDNFCNNYGAVTTTNTQIQTITYAPGIPSNPDGVLAVTERGGNNCFYIEVWGIPAGGGIEQQLGQTFVRNETNLVGVLPPAPPTTNSDYWSSGRNNDSGQIIGIALYQLSELAPVGSLITSIRYLAATNDNGDGKFFLMQTYAQDDSFNPEFNEVFNGDVGANDNVPIGSSYSYFSSTNPLNGSVVVNTDGTFTYTPNPGFTGTDTFEIQVCLPSPNESVCDTSIVTLDVKSGVTIDNAIADEGNNLNYTISINDPIDTIVEFDISYTNSSTTNFDYSGPSTVSLPANASSVSFDVAALNDNWFEGTETFSLSISNPSNIVTITDATGLGTINDTDNATVTTANYDFNEDAGLVQLRVWLNESDAGVEPGFSVDVTIGDNGLINPATAGADYSVTNNTTTISFPPNSPPGTEFFIPLTVIEDALAEPSEQVIQQLGNVVGVSGIGLSGPGGIIRIHDNDEATVILQDITVNEDINNIVYEFILSGDTQDGFNVSFNTSDGVATSPNDYTATSGTVTFIGNNNEVQTISIPVIDDTLIEPSEDFNVIASYAGVTPGFTNAQALNVGISNNPASITILDDDAIGSGIAFDNNSVTVAEGTDIFARFTVSFNGNIAPGQNVTVDYVTNDGVASNGSDFIAQIGTLTFNGATTSLNIDVPIIDDSVIESTEDFSVVLSNIQSNIGVGFTDGQPTNTANGTIIDDDVSGASDGIAVADFTVNEAIGTADFVISYTGPNVQNAFTVDFAVADGSASNPEDYTVATAGNSVTFPGGTSSGDSQIITINIADDSIIESTENINISLSNISNSAIAMLKGNGTGYITDNDSDPSNGVSISDFTVNEAVGTITFDVSLNAAVQGGFDVDYDIIDGTATAGSDYIVTMNGTLNFSGNNGEIQTITVNIVDDNVIENTEAFIASLSNISNTAVAITDADGVGTITDNDGGPATGVSVSGFTVDEAAGTATFQVSLNADVQGGFSVDFTVADGSAVAPEDYSVAAANGTLSFAGNNGEVQSVSVNIVDDTIIEAAEDISVTLSGLSTALINILGANATGTITDNDANGATEGIAVNDFTVNEDAGTATFIISYTGNTVQEAFNVNFNVTDNTAINPDDYTLAATSGTLSFPANTSNGDSQTITVNIINDNISEMAETLEIRLAFDATPPAGVNMLDGQGIGTISDNDISSSDYEEQITILCGDELPEVPILTFMGGCGDYNVVFSEETEFSDDTDDYMVIRIWNVADSCGNTASFQQIVFVMQPQLEEVFIDICVEDDAINLLDFLPEGFDSNGTFEIERSGTYLNNTMFEPIGLEVGEYKVMYSSTEGSCKYFVDFYVNVNKDCVSCDRDKVEVSETVTVNGDGINDLFQIKGVEYCDFTFDVMIFNRWGDKVFEGKDYQNDWGGFAPDKAFGNSGLVPAGTYYYIITINSSEEVIKPMNGYIYVGTE